MCLENALPWRVSDNRRVWKLPLLAWIQGGRLAGADTPAVEGGQWLSNSN
jgi:hypothetical protein